MVNYPYLGPVAHDSGNGNLPIHRIVVHCTAGGSDEGSARGTARYFRMESATGSAHAITDANELVVCAFDQVVCWHAPPNTHSLGIEIECSLSNGGKGHWVLDSHQKKMRRAAKWVAEKCKLHGIPVRKLTVPQLVANPDIEGICGHVDVSLAFKQSSHTDPGPYFPWAQFMNYVQAEYDALNPQPSEDEMTPAQMTELKNFIEDRTQAYAIANNEYVRQVLSSTSKAILAEINEVDDATAAAVEAKLSDDFKALSDQILAAIPKV